MADLGFVGEKKRSEDGQTCRVEMCDWKYKGTRNLIPLMSICIYFIPIVGSLGQTRRGLYSSESLNVEVTDKVDKCTRGKVTLRYPL